MILLPLSLFVTVMSRVRGDAKPRRLMCSLPTCQDSRIWCAHCREGKSKGDTSLPMVCRWFAHGLPARSTSVRSTGREYFPSVRRCCGGCMASEQNIQTISFAGGSRAPHPLFLLSCYGPSGATSVTASLPDSSVVAGNEVQLAT